ncbi:MAG: ATP-binding protein [Actinomycetota bacterium]|nr:ATP-binding protein [Actinomycetota bacterium]
MTRPMLPTGALPAGEVVESDATLELEPLPHLVSRARRFVAEHIPALPPDSRAAVLLLTSELVTNGMIHARTPLVLGVVVSAASVVITVHDLDLDLAWADRVSPERDGGRGLMLVRALAEASALERLPTGGKTAWFRISRPVQAPNEGAAP